MFNEPHDVAADAEFVYVADTWNQRIQVFDHNGEHVFTLTGQPSLASPRGVAAKDKLIYVAEAGAGRVTVYDRAGKLRQTIGALGDAAGQLREPVGVAADGNGDVWVVNSGNNRLERFAADGAPRGSIPVPGWTGSQLKESYLAIDGEGTLYLGDWELGAVRRFRPDGSELPALGSGIRKPSGIARSPLPVVHLHNAALKRTTGTPCGRKFPSLHEATWGESSAGVRSCTETTASSLLRPFRTRRERQSWQLLQCR
jgi:sugar lactone lactonase YvrE